MFGRDVLTNLKHLISPKLRYMGMEELILGLEIMSNIYQVQIHNFKLARQCIIEDQRPIPDPRINTGDLVLVRDHTSKSFMPKYKTDYFVIRLLQNKVEVKDNNGKMSWFHISDVKKTDMITKLICQLPDYDAFRDKGRLNFDPERVKDLGWTLEDQDVIFDPSYISDVPATAVKQRSHPMQLRSAKVQEISLKGINIGDLLQSNSVIQWLSQEDICIIGVCSHKMDIVYIKLCKTCLITFVHRQNAYMSHLFITFFSSIPASGRYIGKFPNQHLFQSKL